MLISQPNDKWGSTAKERDLSGVPPLNSTLFCVVAGVVYSDDQYLIASKHNLIAVGGMSLGEIYTTTLITYDGAGNRLQLTQGSTTTYTLDYAAGMRVLYEQGGAFSDTKHYLYGLACIAEAVNADDPATQKWRYYHRDGQPLVRQTTDEQTHITLTWGYSPAGAILYGEEGPVTNLDCGAIYDWGTGLIYKNGNYFDPNLQIWLSFAPLVVWQAWKAQQKKRQTGRKNKNWRVILFLTLATLLLAAGCTSPGPLDPTATTLPTQTPTCTPTLPPPVIGQIPTNTPFPHPSTFTPFPTVTPVPPSPTNTSIPSSPTPTPIVFPFPTFQFSRPFRAEQLPHIVINEFKSIRGYQENLGGGQGNGHGGVDLISNNDSDTNSDSRLVYAPVTGSVVDYQSSTGTMTVWYIKDTSGRVLDGLEVKIIHVEQPTTYSLIAGSETPITKYSDIGYSDGVAHLHLGVVWHMNGDYRDDSPGNAVYFDAEQFLP